MSRKCGGGEGREDKFRRGEGKDWDGKQCAGPCGRPLGDKPAIRRKKKEEIERGKKIIHPAKGQEDGCLSSRCIVQKKKEKVRTDDEVNKGKMEGG